MNVIILTEICQNRASARKNGSGGRRSLLRPVSTAGLSAKLFANPMPDALQAAIHAEPRAAARRGRDITACLILRPISIRQSARIGHEKSSSFTDGNRLARDFLRLGAPKGSHKSRKNQKPSQPKPFAIMAARASAMPICHLSRRNSISRISFCKRASVSRISLRVSSISPFVASSFIRLAS